jgi:hypothetical protein
MDAQVFVIEEVLDLIQTPNDKRQTLEMSLNDFQQTMERILEMLRPQKQYGTIMSGLSRK